VSIILFSSENEFMMSAKFTTLLTVVTFASVCPRFSAGYGMEKVWKPSVRFDDPASWPEGSFPSVGDVVVMPESEPVFLPQSVVVNTDVVLGMSGAIVFHPSPPGSRSLFPIAVRNETRTRTRDSQLAGEDGAQWKYVKFPGTKKSSLGGHKGTCS
jgi:hypothetical protein